MPIINGQKMACAPCIRGHRSTKCTHATERVMVPVRKPGRPLSLCACPNRPPNCSCGGGGVKVAIPRKQKCGCGPDHNDDDAEDPYTAASSRLHASSSTPVRPAFRVTKSSSISKPQNRYQLPTFDLNLAALGLAGQHNGALGPNMAGVSAGELITSVNPTVQLPIGSQPGVNYGMGYTAAGVNDRPLNQQTFSSAHSVGHNGIAPSPPQGFKIENKALSEQSAAFAALQRQQVIDPNGITDATFMGPHNFPRPGPVSQSSPSTTLGDQGFTIEPMPWNEVKQDVDANGDGTKGLGIESSSKKKSCCGGNSDSRASQQHANGSAAVPQSTYGEPSPNSMQFNTPSPLELKQHQELLPPSGMPFGYQTVFRYPEEYGSWNHPLDPQTYQQIALQGAGAAQASQQGADLSLDMFPSGAGSVGAGTSHECTCGPGCQCVGCLAHPYNSQTIQYVQDAYSNYNIASPTGHCHRGSLDFAATTGVNQQQQQYQIGSPSLCPRNGQQQQLPPDSPVDTQTPSDASGTPGDEQYLSQADFLWATIPIPNCAGEPLSSLAGIGDGLEQQQVYDMGQYQQNQQVQGHSRSQSQGHVGLVLVPDGLPQGMMTSGPPSSVIPIAHRGGMGDMSGLNTLDGGGMSSDLNSAMSSPRTPQTPRGIDGILRAAATNGDGVGGGGGGGGGGSCCGGRGSGRVRGTELSVP
ncbi:putative copper-regulated transcription factor [Sordaria sp. MPI-SDFR-AT-0083]|nr:putative copper-regulated transcription factor [Sordaria sp. MPI-SDFR-AT-0083]